MRQPSSYGRSARSSNRSLIISLFLSFVMLPKFVVLEGMTASFLKASERLKLSMQCYGYGENQRTVCSVERSS